MSYDWGWIRILGNAKWDVRKRVEHANHRAARDESRFSTRFTMEQVAHLAAMAYAGVVPDGDYCDDECSLWEQLRREFHTHNYA